VRQRIKALPHLKTDNQCLVAVVGRPNVGKSTFFNRIVEGQRKAIVSHIAGKSIEYCYELKFD
jgi:predicted GTPase